MGDRRFRFWQRWLFWASVASGVLGLAIAFFQTRFLLGFPELVNQSLWGSDAMPREVETYHRFVHAVLGATMASWSLVLAFVAHHPFRARKRWAWSCFVWALAVWFSIDTSMSLYFGVWPNAVFNVSALLLLGAPLLFTRNAFRTESGG